MNSKLELSIKYVWLVFAAGFFLILLGATGKIMHWPIANPIMLSGLILSCTVWLITFGDIIKQDLREKFVWIVAMLAVPALTPVLYLIRRNHFIKSPGDSH